MYGAGFRDARSGLAPLVAALDAGKQPNLVGAAWLRHHLVVGPIAVAVVRSTGLLHRLGGVLSRVAHGRCPIVPLSILSHHCRFRLRIPRLLVLTGTTHPRVAFRVHYRPTFVTELHIKIGYTVVGYIC